MPPTDASPDTEDTLDLGLPGELAALLAAQAAQTTETAETAKATEAVEAVEAAEAGAPRYAVPRGLPVLPPAPEALLDQVGEWSPAPTPLGAFRLVPVRLPDDLPLVARWMNDPAVAEFWELAGPEHRTEEHLRTRLDGDGRSVSCLGVLDGTPMSYWEIYRADLDPLARHCPARPHDTGVHLLIGEAADRGRGVGACLLRAVADLVFAHRPACARVLAEPDVRNVPSVAAFLGAGFRFAAEVELPGKRAALMIRDRSLRHLL